MFLKQFRWFAVALKYLFSLHIKSLKKFWFNFRIGVGEFPAWLCAWNLVKQFTPHVIRYCVVRERRKEQKKIAVFSLRDAEIFNAISN